MQAATYRRRALVHLAATGAAIALVAWLLPRLLGTTWREIGHVITSVPPVALLGLALLWGIGRIAHTITLAAALPGLTHGRALMLSLTGGAVSNVLPVGGVAGIALNLRMTRAWGHSRSDFAAYTVVTNVWDVLAKVLMPVCVLPLALDGGSTAGHAARGLALSLLVLPVAGAVVAWVVLHPALLQRLRRVAPDPAGHMPAWRVRVARIADMCEQVRSTSAGLAQRQWRRLTLGIVLYTVGLLLLLAACLDASSAEVPLGVVLLAFCAERALTMVPFTPGGVGFVELGLAGVLTLSPAAHGAGVAAGVLLYRLFAFALEIPVGGAMLLAWSWRRHAAGGRGAAVDVG